MESLNKIWRVVAVADTTAVLLCAQQFSVFSEASHSGKKALTLQHVLT
jgi:hypothetical protein